MSSNPTSRKDFEEIIKREVKEYLETHGNYEKGLREHMLKVMGEVVPANVSCDIKVKAGQAPNSIDVDFYYPGEAFGERISTPLNNDYDLIELVDNLLENINIKEK